MTNDKKEQGVTLYIAVIMLAIVLTIALGVGLILFNQLRLVRDTGVSMTVFYAAEVGIERVLRIDVCLLKEDKPIRVACLEKVSGVLESDMPGDCTVPGPLSDSQEQDCRRDLVNNEMNVPYSVDSASYKLRIRDPDANCPGNINWGYCGTSTGTFGDSRRRVEVVR